jgi:hypothetical protein
VIGQQVQLKLVGLVQLVLVISLEFMLQVASPLFLVKQKLVLLQLVSDLLILDNFIIQELTTAILIPLVTSFLPQLKYQSQVIFMKSLSAL